MTESHAQQAGVLVLGKVLATLSDFIVPLVIVRLLGKVEVGVLAALLLIYSTVAMVLTAGFPETLSYFLPARPATERRAIAWAVSRALFLLGCATGLLMLALALVPLVHPGLAAALVGEGSAIGGESLSYLAILALLPLADLPARLLPNLLVVERRARAAAGLGVVKSLGGSLAAIVPLALTQDLMTVVACITAFGVAYGLFVPIYLRALFRGVESAPSPVTSRELVRFAIPLGLTDIVSLLNSQLDRYLVLFFFTAAVFAEYQAGAWQVPMIATIPYAVGVAYTPRLVAWFKEGRPREAIDVWRASITKVSLLVVPLTMVFVVAAEETMELLFTRDYVGAAGVFRIYSILTLGRVATFGSVIVAAGKPRFVLFAALLSFASNAVLSVPLVVLIGPEGAALGTLIAFVPTATYYCWAIGRASGLPLREVFPMASWLRVVGVAALAAVPAVALKLGTDLAAAPTLIGVAVTLIVSFSVVGSAVGLIERTDWSYLRAWFALRILR